MTYANVNVPAPTEPGWWWYKHKDTILCLMVGGTTNFPVSFAMIALVPNENGEWSGNIEKINALPGLWTGPIPYPPSEGEK